MRQTSIQNILIFLLMLLAQMVICNFLHISPYIQLSILPVMILCLPIRYSTLPTLLIAFVAAFSVDLFSDGVLGLNTAALLPVAYLRHWIIRLVFGDELFARGEDFSIRKNGLGKVIVATLLLQGVFLALYIMLDGAGMRPFWFNALRFVCSLVTGTALSVFVADLFAGDDRKK